MNTVKKDIYLVANWKMNPTTHNEAQQLIDGIEKGVEARSNVKSMICPPFIYLPLVCSSAKKSTIGAQNCFYEQKGSFTGEVSPQMIKDMGCGAVILGHSERRAMGETNEAINKKIHLALKASLRPIVAIGEHKKPAQQGDIDDRVSEQLKSAFAGVSATKARSMMVAYEPIWAIGTGEAATADIVMGVRVFIQKTLATLYTRSIIKHIPVLYGGSTNATNCNEFIKYAGMDGLLVGGSSLKPEEFTAMFRNLASL